MCKRLVVLLFLFGIIHVNWSQEIEVSGNGITIPLDVNNTPNLSDGTLYESTPAFGTRNHDFLVENKAQRDIRILSVNISSSVFRVDSRIRRIRENESASLRIIFEPVSLGTFDAVVSIRVRIGRARETYQFNISGTASEAVSGGEIMISQYYEKGNQDEVEIKNLTGYDIPANKYVLAKYRRRDDLDAAPRRNNIVNIGALGPGEVGVYADFGIRGDEILVISTSSGRDCYTDRVDILGVQGTSWGKDTSFSKGGCASDTAHRDFDPAYWIQLTNEEVDAASMNQNLFMGTHQTGVITWTNNSWTANAKPDRTRIVHIDNTYTGINGGIEACDLVVNAPLNFNNQSTRSVVVYRDLDINDAFEIGDTESLVMYDDNALVSGSVKKLEESTLLNNPYDFTYWSSPVAGATISTIFSGVRAGRTYYFDQSRTTASSPDNDPEGTYWYVWVPAGGAMKPGRGYASEADENAENIHELEFNGTPNNGVISEPVYYNNDTDDFNDFNLIGNPYPSAIDINLFFDQNDQVIDPTIYLWTHTTPVSTQTGDYSFNDYATYNRTGGTAVGNGPVPNNRIGSAQGFVIRALASGNVVFNNSMRIVDGNDQFFKSSVVKKINKAAEKDRIWLNLYTDRGGFNQLLIGFVDGATAGFDKGYDALKNQGSNKISFYSVLDDKKLAIQGLGSLESESEVPLGFDTTLGQRTYTIAVSAVEGKLRDAEITLFDHLLQLSHDLRNSNYVFSGQEEGSYPGRFSLTFSPKVSMPQETVLIKDTLQVFNEEDTFSIQSTKDVEIVRIYDMRGNMIAETNPYGKSFDIIETVSKQGDVLLLEVIHTDQTQQTKKIYKR